MKREPLQKSIGQAIRRRREAGPLNQEAFADHIQMHRAYYGELERGNKDIRMSTLKRIAKGLGIPMWEIIRDAESQ